MTRLREARFEGTVKGDNNLKHAIVSMVGANQSNTTSPILRVLAHNGDRVEAHPDSILEQTALPSPEFTKEAWRRNQHHYHVQRL